VSNASTHPSTILLAEIPHLAGTSHRGVLMTVSETERNSFENLTWVDRAYPLPDAPEFPARIVEGFHTLALVDAMAALARPFDPATTYAYNYGLDRVRWVSPVLIGDELESMFEYVEVTERKGGWLVRRRVTISVVGADEPSMIADWLVYVLPRSDV
jgi:acyl dehydratase